MIPRKSPEVRAFLTHTYEDLKSSGIELNLAPESHVFFPPNYRIACNGYFVTNPHILAVGTGKDFDLWFPVYVHEYNHYRQWKEQDPEYTAAFIDGREALDYVDEAMEGKIDLSSDKLWNYVRIAQTMEANCERRSHQMILDFNLPIDAEEYSQKANSYLHFYNFIGSNLKWYTPGKEPYNIPKVWQAFNSSIDSSFPENWNYTKLYENSCI